jgi:ribonuclease D
VTEPRREATSPVPPLPLPTPEAIRELPTFPGIEPSRIRLVASREDARIAQAALEGHAHLGFDTESRPTFVRGERSEGPHVVQFATLDEAWVFQLNADGVSEVVTSLLASAVVTKVGFGLDGDRTQIRSRLGIEPVAILDLDTVFRALGYRRSIGIKAAVAVLFNRRLVKPKRIGTSNWSNRRLEDRQLQYAANDAWAAIQVHAALLRAGRLEDGS